MSNDILWQPHPGPQTEALSWRIFELLYGGARGGGKTDAGIIWMSKDREHPRFRGLVIRKNADDLSDWIERARHIYTPMGANFVGKPVEIKWAKGGAIRTGHLKDDNAYEKYQGHEYQRLLIEELTQIPTEERYLKLLASCRSTIPELKPRAFLTTNPGGPGHAWVKTRFIDVAPPNTFYKDPITGRGRIFIPAKVEDNPTLIKADPQYVSFLESLPYNLKKAWREGRWDIFAGQYFTEWNPEKHIIEPRDIPKHWKRYRAIDFGRASPFACYWVAIDYDGNAYVYREYYSHRPDLHEQGKDADVNALEVVRLSSEDPIIEGRQYQYTVADSSIFADEGHGETIAHLMARVTKNKLLCIPSSKKRIAGWTIMHQYLRHDKTTEPKLKFFNTCHNAIRTIPTLIHDEKRPEDLDTTGEDHAADAIRYLLQTFRERKTKKPLNATQKKILQLKQEMGMSGGYDPGFYE